jgi:hypothetical protein
MASVMSLRNALQFNSDIWSILIAASISDCYLHLTEPEKTSLMSNFQDTNENKSNCGKKKNPQNETKFLHVFVHLARRFSVTTPFFSRLPFASFLPESRC